VYSRNASKVVGAMTMDARKDTSRTCRTKIGKKSPAFFVKTVVSL